MKNKRTDHISNIMSKRHGSFLKNFTVFFSNAGKMKTCQNSKLTNSKIPSLGEGINVTFTL